MKLKECLDLANEVISLSFPIQHLNIHAPEDFKIPDKYLDDSGDGISMFLICYIFKSRTCSIRDLIYTIELNYRSEEKSVLKDRIKYLIENTYSNKLYSFCYNYISTSSRYKILWLESRCQYETNPKQAINTIASMFRYILDFIEHNNSEKSDKLYKLLKSNKTDFTGDTTLDLPNSVYFTLNMMSVYNALQLYLQSDRLKRIKPITVELEGYDCTVIRRLENEIKFYKGLIRNNGETSTQE